MIYIDIIRGDVRGAVAVGGVAERAPMLAPAHQSRQIESRRVFTGRSIYSTNLYQTLFHND